MLFRSLPICPVGSTCQSNQCISSGAICECCCRVGYESQDCCAGLTCEPGNCGPGAPNYGLCTGCRVVINGTVNQAASDQACNCYGWSTRYCDLTNPAYPNGVCRDQATAGQPCYNAATAPSCNPSNPPCATGFYCDSVSCTCLAGGGPGAPCDSDTSTPACDADNNMCLTGYTCNTTSCVCELSGGPAGSPCLSITLPACNTGVSSCLTSYECLDDSGSDCRCCCNPADDQCPAPLSCWANKSPCDGTNRGLCCGCTNDGECNGGVEGCGNDSCCRGRPSVVAPTNPADNATGVCRNVLIKADFE